MLKWADRRKRRLAACAANIAGLLQHLLRTVLAADKGAGHLTSAMWHHAWAGLLVIDLDQPLRRTSGVAIRQGVLP